jgi:transcriptional regulator PpsR
MVVQLRALKRSLGNLNADTAARLVSASTDIALVVDRDGVIEDVAIGNDELPRDEVDMWVGRLWVDTVTTESRSKVTELLQDANSNRATRWRQVNHPSSRGADLPVRYAALQLGQDRRIVALGRELSAVAHLQQRLVDAQQSMEREYARLRSTETRYRLLFQKSAEGVLIVEAASLRVTEANAAAIDLLGKSAKRAIGRNFLELLEPSSVQAAQNMLAAARNAGTAEDVRVQLNGGGSAPSDRDVIVSPSLFRQDNTTHFLIRLTRPADTSAPVSATVAHRNLHKVVESLPDGFVVTDLDQRIVTANSAFLDLAQLASVEQARGSSLDQFLGRSTVECNGLIANLREHGSARNFATVLRGQYGVIEDVEVSGVAVLGGAEPCFGFTIRPLGRRITASASQGRELPHSTKQLTELVGRVPMKTIVRETTDLIERLCIEAALELVGENRASAAEMLGLSRQSLYVKLRRYGIVDVGIDES